MGLTTAERNRRKRERKKREREQQQTQKEEAAHHDEPPSEDHGHDKPNEEEDEIEVEYVAEPLQLPEDDENFAGVVRAQRRAAAAVVSDEDAADGAGRSKKDGEGVEHRGGLDDDDDEEEDYEGGDDDGEGGRRGRLRGLSRRRLRDLLRPTVAELKRRVRRPDLVEAHDVTAPDPEFLIELKSVPGTVPVPRHWGRKRKYLQGKRGFEKAPFQLPDFIVRTGIAEVRDAAARQDGEMSAKQRNRARTAPKMGAIDVDYKVL
jgi:splicing factor 3B subunit 2